MEGEAQERAEALERRAIAAEAGAHTARQEVLAHARQRPMTYDEWCEEKAICE